MTNAIEVKNVRRYFGEVKALDGVSLTAKEGTVFGLLGPNGAGKTTLVRILSTLLDPTSGTAKVFGTNTAKRPDDVRNMIGLAGQSAAVDEFMTGRENLYMVGRLYHLPKQVVRNRANDLLNQLELSEAADRPVRTYSGGMRRRLDLGASLVGQPRILFLDEPTTGLDPRTRIGLWEIIKELVKKGTTILLTTQYLEEADELANHIAVIDRGKVIADGTSNQLKNKLGGDVVEIEVKGGAKEQQQVATILSHLAKKKPTLDADEANIRIPVSHGASDMMSIVRVLDKNHIVPNALALHRPSLDDVFLSLTGEKATDVAKKPKTPKGKKQ